MAKSSSPVLRFLGGIWKTIDVIRRIIITLFVLAVVAVLYFVFVGPPAPQVPQKAALVWAPQGNVVEQTQTGPDVLAHQVLGGAPRQTSVQELKTSLERAAHDKRIKLAVLKLDDLNEVGMAQLQELGEAIDDFKASGKKVIAYAPSYDQKAYYLAAHANRVYMDPMGMVLIQGFGLYNHYFKDALDKLHVQVHVFRQGRYKSAVEPFIRNDMSADARKEDSAWLTDLWNTYKQGVAQGRNIKPQAIDDYANNLPETLQQANGDGAKVALQAGLVNKLITLPELRKQIEKVVGKNSHTGSFNQIDDRNYVKATGGLYKAHSQHEVGLVVVEGPIVDGRGKPGTAGGDTITAELHRAKDDSNISAVVMRVDSPGGSVTASEKIRHAVLALQRAGKPVVVSMSDMGASGGYWISMNANQIWARASTITGSIGIFGIIPTFNKGLNKLGIHTDGVGTNRYSGALRPDMPMNPQVAQAVQSVINNGYQHFIHNVANARHMKVSQVNAIAEGHVWSGTAAKKLGLVDYLGGFNQAVKAAAKLAHLQGPVAVQPIRRRTGLGPELVQMFSRAAVRADVGHVLGVPRWLEQLAGQSSAAKELSWMNDPRDIYAYCPCRPDLGSNKAP